ncbi:MAG TPA: hypothetical protein VI423_00815 [Paenisporosarcina sp.]|nr:hypothetical protein [Paenisporosarcina sp.]
MTITYRFYKSPKDLQRQIDFWIAATNQLPFAWKPTLSPNQFIEQQQFHPKSRCFAFDGDKIIGYMSFTGSSEFVSLGYPWVLSGYEGEVQDELYNRIYGFAVSEAFGAKMFAQRFRSDWTQQIEYFLSKGFAVTRRSSLLVSNLNKTVETQHDVVVDEGFDFDIWQTMVKKHEDTSAEQFDMMREYYGSVDFDFSIEFDGGGYFGVTIRQDTGYAEILAVACHPNAQNFSDMVEIVMQECKKRDVKSISMAAAHVPIKDSLKRLGFTEQTEDVMMMKKSDPTE